jgi:hypothetical protein
MARCTALENIHETVCPSHFRDSLSSSAGTLEEAHGVDVRRGAAKLPHAVSLARFGRLRSITFRHEQYISSIPTGEMCYDVGARVWVRCASAYNR